MVVVHGEDGSAGDRDSLPGGGSGQVVATLGQQVDQETGDIGVVLAGVRELAGAGSQPFHDPEDEQHGGEGSVVHRLPDRLLVPVQKDLALRASPAGRSTEDSSAGCGGKG